jgi:hypothetical protein
MCGCLIGKDYPAPMVNHETVCKVNMQKMKDAYDLPVNKDKKEPVTKRKAEEVS